MAKFGHSETLSFGANTNNECWRKVTSTVYWGANVQVTQAPVPLNGWNVTVENTTPPKDNTLKKECICGNMPKYEQPKMTFNGYIKLTHQWVDFMGKPCPSEIPCKPDWEYKWRSSQAIKFFMPGQARPSQRAVADRLSGELIKRAQTIFNDNVNGYNLFCNGGPVIDLPQA
jgi:hypothetical protein